MVLADRVGQLLHQDRLTGLGRRDESALSFADGREQVHDPHREIACGPFQPNAPVGIARLEVVERDPDAWSSPALQN
jgi:hypothetical protein